MNFKKNKENKSTWFNKTTVSILLVLALGLVLKPSVESYFLNKRGILTKAVVTKFEFKNIRNNMTPNKGNGYSSYMEYEFKINDIKYSGNKSISIEDFRFPSSKKSIIGTNIQIIYLPNFPQINKVSYDGVSVADDSLSK